MKMKLKIITQEIIDQYQLQDLEEDGWVYTKIVKGMTGLKQAVRLENERLVHQLAPYGYAPVQHPLLYGNMNPTESFLPSWWMILE